MSQKKILLIDDEDLVVKSVSRLLKKAGYEVVSCGTGKEGVAVASNQDFDLIICDIRMPDINGPETIRQIRDIQIKNHKNTIPEILITGFAEDKDNKEVEALGVTEYIYKPFDLITFLECVEKNIGNG